MSLSLSLSLFYSLLRALAHTACRLSVFLIIIGLIVTSGRKLHLENPSDARMRSEKPEAVTSYDLLSRYRSDGRRCTPAEKSRSNNRSFVCTCWELAVFSRRGCAGHAPVRPWTSFWKGLIN